MHVGWPEPGYPFPWALYAWIEGEEVSSASVTDWARYAEDLANIVCSLHTIDRMGIADWRPLLVPGATSTRRGLDRPPLRRSSAPRPRC